MKILAGTCAVLLVGLLLALWRLDHVSTSLTTATDTIVTLNAAAESRRNTQRLLLDLDTRHTQELTNAQNTNAQLRAAVATGKRRLSVIATCPAVRATASPTGVDDDQARADIDPAAAERIVTIANDGDDAIRALSGLQDYITTACTPRK
ncbi:lysis system i-spanin subunit Rz [Pseudomonas alliivorans]|nr:lysis system i-spanin subunit Rz [Pseudomonas alliivorans]MEE4710192.1 lysis system i-spanin subunit Rz [Pseudomonas alliivorans]MEE4725201.1 lysis system i-spanin subunit Rz [Pseudomonas alliivorans]MEE4765938.1 lysis system i-spanin subunit Rz [Pseudomonas alliivorans]